MVPQRFQSIDQISQNGTCRDPMVPHAWAANHPVGEYHVGGMGGQAAGGGRACGRAAGGPAAGDWRGLRDQGNKKAIVPEVCCRITCRNNLFCKQ